MKLNNRIPVEVVGDYVICFEALPEDTDKEHHFINECGWTPEQYAAFEDTEWFIAEVSIWQGGECLACEYLGGCCYDKIEDFYKRYGSDYYKDMRDTLLAHVQRNAA